MIPPPPASSRGCPKCGGYVSQPLWHDEDSHRDDLVEPCRENHNCLRANRSKPLEEHLHFVCGCGYDWVTPPLDEREEIPW